jgi:Na+-driven multidrug efflux pump
LTVSVPNPALHAPPLGLFLGQMLPTLLSLLAVSSTTIVDGLFVGRYVGADGLAALNLLNPLLNVFFALALMLALGASVRAGAAIGAGNLRAASDFFAKTLLTVLMLSLGIVIAGLLFATPLFRFLGGSAELLPLMADYFDVILPFFIVKAQLIALYFFVRLDDSPRLVAASFLLAALAKIVLATLFVAQWDLGLRGAALSTGLAHVLAALLLLRYFRKKDRRLHLARPRGSWLQVWRSALNGVSEFVNESSVGIVAFTLNWLLLLRAGVDGVAAIAAYNYTMQIALMLYFSIAHAGQTLISQNHGAILAERVRALLKLALGFAFAAGLGTATCVYWLALPVAGLFLGRADAATLDLAAELLRALWPAFALAGFNIVIAGYFTAMHRPVQATALALMRSLVLPALLLLVLFQALPDASFVRALALAEGLTFILAVFALLRWGPGRDALERPL